MPQSFVKDPDAVLDYKIDWSSWLAQSSPADTISSSSWSAETGITVDTSANTTTDATVWLSGGSAGRKYAVTNQIVTAGGRTVERTIYVTVVER